jgi:rare lipoprotein A
MKKNFILVIATSLIAGMLLLPTFVLAETGTAVHYSNKFQGKKTANGEIFDQNGLTAAHKKFPYGTQVKVTNLENDRSVIVKINDRMRKSNRNIIDVTRHAAEELGFIKQGRARVSLEVVN